MLVRSFGPQIIAHQSGRQMSLGLVPTDEDSYESEIVEGTNERMEPYILVPKKEAEETSKTTLLERLAHLNVLVNDEIPLINGFTAVMNQATREAAERNGFTAIPDRDDKFLHPEPWERKDDRAAPAAPAAEGPRPVLETPRFMSYLTQSYTGKGVGIAVIDTGVYPHPDLTYPHSRIVAFKDFVNDRSLPYDDNGHGTHVAGDAAGSGFKSNGIHRGTAPDASIVGVKVLDADGYGSTSRILEGLNWAVENRERYNIRVINLSLGTSSVRARSQEDPIRQAVEKASDAGIVVVVSAGNKGPNYDTITSPADSPKVITVGAVDDRNTPWVGDDHVASFSSRGARGSAKPDIMAPGEAIIGPNAPNSRIEATAKKYTAVHETLSWLKDLDDSELTQVPEHTLRLIGLRDDSIHRFKRNPAVARSELNRLIETTQRLPMVQTDYIGMPGTSTAAPIVAGVVAQMLEANPMLSPADVKDILRQSATPVPKADPEAQGAGLVNPHEAIRLSLARAAAPDEDGQLKLPFYLARPA